MTQQSHRHDLPSLTVDGLSDTMAQQTQSQYLRNEALLDLSSAPNQGRRNRGQMEIYGSSTPTLGAMYISDNQRESGRDVPDDHAREYWQSRGVAQYNVEQYNILQPVTLAEPVAVAPGMLNRHYSPTELSRFGVSTDHSSANPLEQAAREVNPRLAEINHQFSRNGSMSHQEADNYFPAHDKTWKNAANEPTDTASVVDMISYMNHPHRRHPYDTVHASESGHAIGKYGLTADIIIDWLSNTKSFAPIMGSPPDLNRMPELMERLSHERRLPANYAALFKTPGFSEEFVHFLGKMNDPSSHISRAEIERHLPKGAQEAIMHCVVNVALAHKYDAASLALAMEKGKPVSNLSSSDLSKPENQNYMYAALKVLGLALAKNQSGPEDQIHWEKTPNHSHRAHVDDAQGKTGAGNDGGGTGTNLAFSIAHAAESNARRTGTIGWCYRSVAHMLDRFGIHLYGESAYEAAPQLARNKHFKEVPIDQLKKGTVLVFGPTHKHPYGHITVYLGNGMEASDHVQSLVNFKKYSGVRAFEPTA